MNLIDKIKDLENIMFRLEFAISNYELRATRSNQQEVDNLIFAAKRIFATAGIQEIINNDHLYNFLKYNVGGNYRVYPARMATALVELKKAAESRL